VGPGDTLHPLGAASKPVNQACRTTDGPHDGHCWPPSSLCQTAPHSATDSPASNTLQRATVALRVLSIGQLARTEHAAVCYIRSPRQHQVATPKLGVEL